MTAILRLLVFLLAAMCLSPVGLAANAAAVREQKLRDRYEASLQKMKPDDDQGRTTLAKWCKQNKLTREADELWQGLHRAD